MYAVAIASILQEVEERTKGEAVVPGALWGKLSERFALIAYSTAEVKAQAQRAGVTGEITYFQPSYAVLRLDAKQTVAVREGGEIEPGVRLVEVHADRLEAL